MRALLVNPEFPDSYWSGRYSLPMAGRRSFLPPLSLLTVAALLPEDWECRLVDLNVEPLTDGHLDWCDAVMLTGMIVQRTSLHEVLQRCRRMGVRTVVGGPYATALPQDVSAADVVVVGEGEQIVPQMAADLAAGNPHAMYRETEKPDMTTSPLPRYELLRPGAYHHMCLQYSRGCPFSCEFCDIIVMYGQKPRTKSPAQVIAELEAIRRTGFAGDVFFVDDNFIGNKKAVRTLLPEVEAWRGRTAAPLEFYTEASINIADDGPLVDQMTRAGFTGVFIGIESPSAESLKETHKLQNLRRDMVTQVHELLDRGLDVYAGFILGFDNDGPDCFDKMIDFVQRAAIPYAMVGMLTALPNTPLYKQLEREGRLRFDATGDTHHLTNVITRLPTEQMVAGYRRVLETLYHPETYFRRCRENLAQWKSVAGSRRPLTRRDLKNALRVLWTEGVTGPYRGAYWRFLAWVLRHHPEKIGRAMAQAGAGHHFITYTRDVVVPALTESLPVAVEGQPALAS